MSTIKQPQWLKPIPKEIPKLVISNSLTKQKEEFIPKNGNQVSFYICGPTVYDKSHLGHARTYISFDIIRRIMEEYFGYNVLYVMNITDVDDKQFLFDEYKEKHNDLLSDVSHALEFYLVNKLTKFGYENDWNSFLDKVKSGSIGSDDPKFNLYVETAKKTFLAIDVFKSDKNQVNLLSNARDVISLWIDDKKGHSVTDQKISKDFATYWEADYFKDMDALNIRRPDILTRVSDYIPEIISFCEKIMKNGYGYELDGSVYFDTVKFNSSKDHDYAKLAPWSAGNVKLVEEGEGDLASKATNKKTPSDFALWKNSKPGEPYWDSPWGKGRPGWHIECSVMASAIIGDGMDIHGGGIDLMFPHHDNELAQSEAHFECKQWVNYFMHTGHLHIENLKMSKSLKNFLTISDTLKKTSSSQLRLMFLLHSWDTVFDYSASSISEAKIVESTIQNFLSLVNALSNETVTSQGHNYSSQEAELILNLQKKQDAVHAAICDSFNTPLAMNEIRGLISLANIYYADKQKLKQPPNIAVMYKIARYISRILRIFGLFENQDIIGTFGGAPKSSANLIPILKTMSEFRDNIRNLAQSNADPKQILEVCDKFRDEDMIEHGVVLEDREGGNALVKLVDKELLQAQKEEQKMKLEIQKQLKLERKQKEQAQLEQRRLKAQLNPSDMFKTDEYSDWDEQGLPLKMKDGEQVTKSKRKKLLKEFEAQTKLYNEFNSK